MNDATDIIRDTEIESRFSADDDADHVILAIDKKDSNTIGCSYYSAQEEKLYLLRDIHSPEKETSETR